MRINVTAVLGADQNQDVAINMDVHDASQGVQDSWIFYGDYISAAVLDHDPRGLGTFAQLINYSFPQYFPAEESGGTSFAQSGDGARLLPDGLSVFPGQFVVLSFGSTDADFFDAGKPELPGDFYKNYDLLVKAGLPPMRFHDARHTAAVLMLAQGIPLKVVSQVLGHSKISTTADIYAHVLPRQEQEAADLMGDLLWHV